MPYWEYLNLDEKTKAALKAREKEKLNKKLILVMFLMLIFPLSYVMFLLRLITHEMIQFIYSAIIGGIIGSSVTYVIEK